MCLHVNVPYSGREPLIAKEDMTVYKSIIRNTKDNSGYPYYYSEVIKYQIGKKNPVVELDLVYNQVHKGYHSWASQDQSFCQSNSIFIIPKGSKYYIGIHNDYVSNQIIFKEWIKNG